MACPSNVTKGSSSGSAVGVAPTIGIDLGTTYSCVAVWQREHGVQIIPNDQGHRITPSVVAFTDKERFVGNAALNQAEMNPTNTVFDVKRLIGKRYKGKVEEDARNWPFKVVDGGNDKPMVAVKYKGKPKLFAAEMISSMILAKMKHVAEMYLGQPVENAVVTVPAYFSDSQRKATMDAGKIAGLNVLRIINEPTAAALAYGYHKENSASKNVLVFDLGGGTFDVSLVNIEDRILDVKATKGDTHLGGEDFNDRMVSHFVAEFCRKYPSGTNIIDNPKALCRLRMKCEEAKQRLSSSTTATIHIAALHNGIDFESSMTRAKFEDLNNALFQKCLKIVADCLSDAKIDKRDVGEVVLVGGSTRIPKVKELLKEFFSGREPRSLISPDEAVAYGAAVQAAMLQGITNKKAGDEKVIDMVLHDVTPLSLGVEVKGGLMEVVIRRNTPVPTTKEKRFTTSKDDHTDVGFTVFEGERSMTKNNNLLGEFTLHGIPPAPEGIPKLTVTFTIDADGILHAEAKDKGTGRRAEITISNDRGRLRTEELQKLIREADMYRKEDEKMRKKAEARNELESYAYKVRNALNAMIGKGVSGEERIVVDKALGKVFSWLERNPEPSVDASQRETTKLRDVWTPIIERVYDRQSRPRLAL